MSAPLLIITGMTILGFVLGLAVDKHVAPPLILTTSFAIITFSFFVGGNILAFLYTVLTFKRPDAN